MQIKSSDRPLQLIICAALACMTLFGCNSLPTKSAKASACAAPSTNQLSAAFQQTKDALSAGCQARFDRYLTRLLDIAEGDPQPDNKRYFSEFLVWSTDQGLISKRQAREHYNRYFSPKFVALMGDYNNCASTCPAKNEVLLNMRSELQSKETGLLKVSLDREGYYRADRLFQETELVLEATCQACATAN
jgi:hypothetical protein